MGREKKKKKEKKKKSLKKNKTKVTGKLKLFSLSELEDQSSLRQSRAKIALSSSDDASWQLKLFSPNENDINAANHLTWTIGGFRESEIKFDPLNPLMIYWKHSITVREWDDSTKAEKIGSSDQVITLKPEYHGVWAWPNTGATGYFKNVRTAYNSQYSNDTELLQVANLDELNTLMAMDLCINPDEDSIKNARDFGRTPLLNNGGGGSTYLKQTLGATPNLNYYDINGSKPSTFNFHICFLSNFSFLTLHR